MLVKAGRKTDGLPCEGHDAGEHACSTGSCRTSPILCLGLRCEQRTDSDTHRCGSKIEAGQGMASEEEKGWEQLPYLRHSIHPFQLIKRFEVALI